VQINKRSETKIMARVGEVTTPAGMFVQIGQKEERRNKRFRRNIWAALIVLTILILEANFSGMALITPIADWLLWSMRLLGLIAGATLWRLIRHSPNFNESNRIAKFSLAVMLPLTGAFIFDGLTWRAAVWWEFGLSSAPLEMAVYPVARLDYGRRSARAALKIDPFRTGQNLAIPIPWEQYEELRSIDEPLCVQVRQHRSRSGAIEVRSDGSYTANEPHRVRAGLCSAVDEWAAKPSG